MAISLAAVNPGNAREWFVAADGKPGNEGTIAAPWDLESGIGVKRPIQGGDTIWLRGGVYRNDKSEFHFRVSGQESKPVVIRNYRGERATIDGAVHVEGSDVWIWGLEVTVSQPRPDRPLPTGSHPAELTRPAGGFHASNIQRSKVINCVVHDNNQGLSWWLGATDTEIYGCLIYQNGWVGVDRTHGHAIYTQNDKGTKRIVDNIMFDAYSYLLHAYGSSRAYVNGFHVEGNIFFGGSVLIGGGRPSERITFLNNLTYRAQTQFGYDAPYNEDVVCMGNYFTSPLQVKHFRRASVQDNNFVAGAMGSVLMPDGASFGDLQWDNNRYVFTSADNLKEWQQRTGLEKNSTFTITREGHPLRSKIVIRSNMYEPGRANIAVFNWENSPHAEIDLSGVVRIGQAYEIRNVQDYFGPAATAGIYQGGKVNVPLLRGAKRRELKLAGDPAGRTWDVFGDYPDFDAFVLLPVAKE